MTYDEAIQFLSEEAMPALPGVRACVVANAKDEGKIKLTADAWAKAIQSATIEEAREALGRMVSGEVELLGYQFSMFPAHLMSVIRDARVKRNRIADSEKLKRDIGEPINVMRRLEEGDHPFTQAYQVFLNDILPRFRRNEISRADALAEHKSNMDAAERELTKGRQWTSV